MGFLKDLRDEVRATEEYTLDRTGRRRFLPFAVYTPWYVPLGLSAVLLPVGVVMAVWGPLLTGLIITSVGVVTLANALIRYRIYQVRRRRRRPV